MQNSSDRKLGELEGVSRTLLLPLWARAKESQQPHPILVDNRARHIVESLSAVQGYKNTLDEMDRVFDNYYQLSQLIRAKCIDDEITTFLKGHPQATVVNLGAGFDTTFERVDNGSLIWYDLDLPAVIALRRQFIPETERSRCIAKSILDTSWFDDIGEARDSLMIVSCGVFIYLTENQVKQLMIELATRFPGSELVFDTMSRLFLTIGNWAVLRKSGMGRKAVMRWAIKSAREIEKWDNRITVIDEYPLFSRISLDAAWGKASLNRMKQVNRMRGINIFHLSLKPPQ